MNELKVAKRIIGGLLKRIELEALEYKAAVNEISDREMYRFAEGCRTNPERFDRRELEQMIRTVVKLTGRRDWTAEDLADLINVEKSDVIRVYD